MKRTFRRGDDAVELEVEPAGGDGALRVRLPDGAERTVRARRLPSGDIEVQEEGGRVFRVPLAHGARGAVSLAWGGTAYELAPAAGRSAGAAAAKSSGVLTAPMVGVVAAVHVAVGDKVVAYQPVAVVEAMKVLATLEAPFAGTVRAVHAAKGDRVEHGAPLVEVEPAEAAG